MQPFQTALWLFGVKPYIVAKNKYLLLSGKTQNNIKTCPEAQ